MKTKIICFTFLMFLVILATANNCFSQATSSDPAQPATAPNEPFSSFDYLGWDNSVTIPLEIKTENTYPINFYTDYATSPALRMTILANGKVAVNNTTVATNSRLEVNNDVNLTSSVQ